MVCQTQTGDKKAATLVVYLSKEEVFGRLRRIRSEDDYRRFQGGLENLLVFQYGPRVSLVETSGNMLFRVEGVDPDDWQIDVIGEFIELVANDTNQWLD